MKISIIVPAYNEEEVIGEFIKEALKIKLKGYDYEILIVNDGSKDKTAKIVRAKKNRHIRLVNHPRNLGLGAALKTGFSKARGDIIVTMDSDLTHPPSFIQNLLDNLKKTNSDVCIASRYVRGGGMKNVPEWRILISKIANIFFAFMYNIKARDVTAGFKAYRAEKIKKIKIKRTDFAVQLEIMAKLARNGAKFSEIPFVLENRKKGTSKFRPSMYLKYLTVIRNLK